MLTLPESHSMANTALRAMWLPGGHPIFKRCHSFPVPLGWQSWSRESRLGRWQGAIKPGHKTAQRCWSNQAKAEAAWQHLHSLALPDTISARLCPHRNTRAATGAHGQQGLALLRVINRVLFDPSLSRAAAEGCAYRGLCCAFSAFQLCQGW